MITVFIHITQALNSVNRICEIDKNIQYAGSLINALFEQKASLWKKERRGNKTVGIEAKQQSFITTI